MIEYLKKTNIDKIYYNDIIILLNRIDNYEQYFNDIVNKELLYLITLRVLNNIDLSKVEFTQDKKICQLFKISFKTNNINFKTNNINFSISNHKYDISYELSNIIINYINNIISIDGGIIIYDIINEIYEISSMSYDKQYIIHCNIISFKDARYAKIIKLKNKITTL